MSESFETEDISLTLSTSGDDASEMSDSACELRPASEPAGQVLQEPSKALLESELVTPGDQTVANDVVDAQYTKHDLRQQITQLQKELVDARSELSITKDMLSTARENEQHLQVFCIVKSMNARRINPIVYMESCWNLFIVSDVRTLAEFSDSS